MGPPWPLPPCPALTSNLAGPRCEEEATGRGGWMLTPEGAPSPPPAAAAEVAANPPATRREEKRRDETRRKR